MLIARSIPCSYFTLAKKHRTKLLSKGLSIAMRYKRVILLSINNNDFLYTKYVFTISLQRSCY